MYLMSTEYKEDAKKAKVGFLEFIDAVEAHLGPHTDRADATVFGPEADAAMELIEGRWVAARDHYHFMQYIRAGEDYEQEARDAWNLVGSELLEFRTSHVLSYPSDWRTDDQALQLHQV